MTGLKADTRYASKVAAINSVGDGVLRLASIPVFSRAGASALYTTASGSALSKVISGWIKEEQIVSFATHSCLSDKLILSFRGIIQTKNLLESSVFDFENSLENLPGIGDIHVTRMDLITLSGVKGYSWTVTYVSLFGDVPNLTIDLTKVQNGVDSTDNFRPSTNYVTEFLKGKANEFIIEPKNASGAVVRDVKVINGKEGLVIFFTELWTADKSILDGSHV